MRAEEKSFTVEAMVDAARTILTTYDAHMAGGQSVPDEVANRIARGAAFGAAAYEVGMSGGQDVHALLRATLLGIIDPADPALDYLRAGNQRAEAAPAADVDDGWGWWSGYDGENYNGPFASRVEAVASLSGEAGYIVEARQDPVDLASYVDAEDLLERAEDVAYDLSNENGDPIFEAKPEQIADLGKRLKAACDAWQVAHGLTFTPYRFTASRNEERIEPETAPDAGVVDHA